MERTPSSASIGSLKGSSTMKSFRRNISFRGQLKRGDSTSSVHSHHKSKPSVHILKPIAADSDVDLDNIAVVRNLRNLNHKGDDDSGPKIKYHTLHFDRSQALSRGGRLKGKQVEWTATYDTTLETMQYPSLTYLELEQSSPAKSPRKSPTKSMNIEGLSILSNLRDFKPYESHQYLI